MKKIRKIIVLAVSLLLLFPSVMSASATTLRDLFDAEYYASTYADVKAVFGEDEEALYQHYLDYGMKEGRNASSYFDVQTYRKLYGDLEQAFGDDWEKYVEHYLTFGLQEGRDGGGEVDVVSYAKRYPDLYKAFGYDFVKLREHYETFGKNENRNPLSEVIINWLEEEEKTAEQESPREETGKDEPDKEEPVKPSEPADPTDRTEEFYDEDGYLYIYTYDAEDIHVKTDIYDPDGAWYGTGVFEYDESHNCVKATWNYFEQDLYIVREYDAAGRTIYYMYDDPVDEYFEEISYEYDEDGSCSSATVWRYVNSYGGLAYDKEWREYDKNGLLIFKREEMEDTYPEDHDLAGVKFNGNTYEYTYDATGRLIEEFHTNYGWSEDRDVLCSTYHYIYDANGEIKESEGYEYDFWGRYGEIGAVIAHHVRQTGVDGKREYHWFYASGVEERRWDSQGNVILIIEDDIKLFERIGDIGYEYSEDGSLMHKIQYYEDGTWRYLPLE